MIRCNGGETVGTDFKLIRTDSDIRAFYGIGDVECSFDMIPFLEEFPEKDILPVAKDSFGNYFVIGLSQENSGKVFFCDHEKGMKPKLLTDTFEEFIKKCKSRKIDPARTRSVEERERTMREAGNEMWITGNLRRMWSADIEKYSSPVQERVKPD